MIRDVQNENLQKRRKGKKRYIKDVEFKEKVKLKDLEYKDS